MFQYAQEDSACDVSQLGDYYCDITGDCHSRLSAPRITLGYSLLSQAIGVTKSSSDLAEKDVYGS